MGNGYYYDRDLNNFLYWGFSFFGFILSVGAAQLAMLGNAYSADDFNSKRISGTVLSIVGALGILWTAKVWVPWFTDEGDWQPAQAVARSPFFSTTPGHIVLIVLAAVMIFAGLAVFSDRLVPDADYVRHPARYKFAGMVVVAAGVVLLVHALMAL